MDNKKVGSLILKLRKEKNMTQKDLADKMHISDKTISKWERGNGCPDVSLLNQLSSIFNVNIEKILEGSLTPSQPDGGNMKKIKFYVCKTCGNVLTATTSADVSCCGRKLVALIPKDSDENHHLKVESIESDYYVTFDHEMNKDHYISFVAYVSYSSVLLMKLYPEQDGQLRFPKIHGGKLYFYCNQHGFWVNK
jgi:DNA-binding XRE family transcriptional regulator/desulfoferrodoxin (superoxide reductase-like protein)